MAWTLNENRIPTVPEVKLLLKVLKTRHDAAIGNRHRQPVVDYSVVMTLVGSGVRSHELVALEVRDLHLGHGEAAIIVRHGKGDKQRVVAISERLKAHLKSFLRWKAERREWCGDEAPLFLSERGEPFTTRGVRHLFKRCLAAAGLPLRFGVHSLRHFHATALYQSSKNLLVCQAQMGHSSPATTSIYTHITLQDRKDTVDRIF